MMEMSSRYKFDPRLQGSQYRNIETGRSASVSEVLSEGRVTEGPLSEGRMVEGDIRAAEGTVHKTSAKVVDIADYRRGGTPETSALESKVQESRRKIWRIL